MQFIRWHLNQPPPLNGLHPAAPDRFVLLHMLCRLYDDVTTGWITLAIPVAFLAHSALYKTGIVGLSDCTLMNRLTP